MQVFRDERKAFDLHETQELAELATEQRLHVWWQFAIGSQFPLGIVHHVPTVTLTCTICLSGSIRFAGQTAVR